MYCTGLVREVLILIFSKEFFNTYEFKCTAMHDNLDDPDAGRRTHELTEELMIGLKSSKLWDY